MNIIAEVDRFISVLKANRIEPPKAIVIPREDYISLMRSTCEIMSMPAPDCDGLEPSCRPPFKLLGITICSDDWVARSGDGYINQPSEEE